MRALKCLRCGAEMEYICTEQIQLGKAGLILGLLPNIIAGTMTAQVYSCPQCGKIEFFQTSETQSKSGLPQKKCPRCGNIHDFDYPKCPFCKFDYNSK